MKMGNKSSTKGTLHTLDRRVKQSLWMKEWHRTHKHPMLGRVHTDETRAKIVLANTGRKHTDKSKANMSKAQKLRWKGKTHSDEAKAKISKANKGRIRSEEAKVKTSQSLRKWYKTHTNPMLGKSHTEETKAKMSQSSIGYNPSQETRLKMSRILKDRTFTPEWKAKISQGLRKFYKEHPERHPNAFMGRKGKNNKEERTDIERLMGQALSDVNIDAMYNHPVGSLWVDYAIFPNQIAIECDGEYWHRDKEKDTKRDMRLKNSGWTVLHFTGTEIKTDMLICIERIQESMNKEN